MHFARILLTYFICLGHQNNLINQQIFQSIFQSPRNLFCEFKSFASSHRSKINSIQNQCKIRGRNFNTFHVTGNNWKLECSSPQSFVPQGISIPVPVQKSSNDHSFFHETRTNFSEERRLLGDYTPALPNCRNFSSCLLVQRTGIHTS